MNHLQIVQVTFYFSRQNEGNVFSFAEYDNIQLADINWKCSNIIMRK